MIIQAKNPELYRRWLSYFERDSRPGYECRTEAFLRSQRGEQPPTQ